MFINDVHKKEEIRNIAIEHLRKYGIKYRPKKCRPATQALKYGKKVFKVPLQNLETETVTLSNGQQLKIPKCIHEMCSYILTKVQTEGLFRKEGSRSRQNEIKLSLDRGCLLGYDHHVIDVAGVLKCFLRELPEPLIPFNFHELFLRCSIIKDKLDALLLNCLLLPPEHLSVLNYLMQFFYEVGTYSHSNKMTYSNLAIVIGPNILPVEEKIVPKSSLVVTKICDITKLLIENCRSIGIIPDYIIDQIGHLGDIESGKRQKKRRSGSLTRMLSSIKKIVGSKNDEAPCLDQLVTPDLLLMRSTNGSVKKKRSEGLSAKKKKELLTKLPDCALLNNPFTPSRTIRTPISNNPNGGKLSINPVDNEKDQPLQKEKKHHWYTRTKSMKSIKENEETAISLRRNSLGTKGILERRWSAVSNAANFRRKKRSSCISTKEEVALVGIEKQENDYVRVPKTEYDAIKNRVSAIEKRISLELDNAICQMETDIVDIKHGNIQNVQTAYEKTLVQSGSLSPTTDHLAKRLSRELKIRRSAEHRIIRSPSARKIGSIRQKSGEREKRNSALVRHQSWHVGSIRDHVVPSIPRASLRKKKNPTKDKVLLQAFENTTVVGAKVKLSSSYSKAPGLSSSPSKAINSSPIQHPAFGVDSSENNTFNDSGEHWTSAEGYFNSTKTPQESVNNTRASIAKLRSQNIGMVRAKARLFDTLQDSGNSASGHSSKSLTGSTRKATAKAGYKIGTTRSSEARMSYRIRALRNEERRSRKSISPRHKNLNISQKRLQQLGREYIRANKSNSPYSGEDFTNLTTPRRGLIRSDTVSSPRKTAQNMPHIKTPLAVKTPKGLCRTPAFVNKKTPLKVLSTPI
ncbi:rho GTPase-activating protein gacN-like isoform X2 [Cylas formicarius]|uniref:rho GTPase-activating protein gacN-like isoform X2 n=1 Tax=Cylas formicarius TaxID=197179 RepID=UPI0029583C66|nr:rho GTPase-activating protein gacN-like isoform X2 [Cylas formicarius]